MPISRRTTSSSNLRPMRRFTANRVFCGLVTAWRLADWPTRTSSSLVKATMDGVVRSPSLFSITRGLPPSMMATHELVVPRSMPITFAMGSYSANLFLSITKGVRSGCSFWGAYPEDSRPVVAQRPSRARSRGFGHDDPGRAQHATVQLITGLEHLQDRIRLRSARGLGHHGLVTRGVERLAQR